MSNITKIKPYVYKLTHKNTKEFYFGSRWANIVSATNDLGILYFTSSYVIEEKGFNNFKYEILKEYNSKEEAYDAEQLLIYKNRKNSLLLNKWYTSPNSGKKRSILHKHSEETKKKISKTNKKIPSIWIGRKHSEESKQKMRKPKSKEHREKLVKILNDYRTGNAFISDNHRKKISIALIGNTNAKGKKLLPRSKEYCEKMRRAKLGKPSPKKGKTYKKILPE